VKISHNVFGFPKFMNHSATALGE